MRSVIVVVHLLLFGVIASGAVAGERDNSLVPGAWAIQFELEDNIGLKAYDGMTIALKRQRSAHSALRLGTKLTFDVSDGQSGSSSVRDSLVSDDRRDSDRKQFGLDLDLIYQRYTNPGQAVNWFWGGGPTVGFARRTDSDHSYDQSPSGSVERSTESESTQWSVGAVATAGAEWFATSYLSFHAEYRASIHRVSSDTSRTSETLTDTGGVSRQTSSNDGSGWSFDGVQVLFGLSAYF